MLAYATALSKTDNIPQDQIIVNVFALTNQNVGLGSPWQSYSLELGIILVMFQVIGQNIVRTIYYVDGSSHTSSTSAMPHPLPCLSQSTSSLA
jgi:hypothetical protein